MDNETKVGCGVAFLAIAIAIALCSSCRMCA